MKLGKWFQGLIYFWAALGMAMAGGLIYLAVNNPYNLGSLVKVTWLTENRALETHSKSDLVEGAILGMVESMGDPYTVYMPREEYQELGDRLQGSFNGVGIVVGATEDNKITVVAPIKESPAAKAGIKSGDIIIAINGVDARKMTVDKAVKLIRGEPGTKVEIRIFRASEDKEIDFSMIRDAITLESVDSRMLEDGSGIAYLQISQFTAQTSVEFSKHLEKVLQQGAKAIIIDLREDPGGDFNAAVDVADMIMDDGDIVKIVDRDKQATVFAAAPGGIELPLAVLINGGSASSSEILAGALKDNELAVLVGEKSFGKGLVQTVYPLGSGDALVLTTDKYFTPNDIDINKKGIIPDFIVNIPPGSEGDPQLDRAAEILKTKLGD